MQQDKPARITDQSKTMKNIKQQNSKQSHSGFTLIEILITVLILGIGLLGLAGLQTKGLQYDQVAFMRSQAAILADDIVDRMRANLLETQINGGYDIAFEEVSTTTADCAAVSCDSTTMAGYDLKQWKDSLAAILPSGDGEITSGPSVNGAAPAVDVTVTVHWDEVRSGATGTDCPQDPSNGEDLACFQIVVSM